MLVTDLTIFPFKYREIWFSDHIYDVRGCDSVIFRECKTRWDMQGFRRRDFTTLVIDLGRDLEMIWSRMSRSNCRRPINRALRDGVTVDVNRHYEEFYDINRAFRKMKGLSHSNVSIDFMKRYGTLFTAEHDGELLSGLLCIADQDNMIQLITGSRRLDVTGEARNFIGNANKLMIWASIEYAKEHGIKEYDMGGYYTGRSMDPQMENINRYKKNFGGEVACRYIYRKDYSLPIRAYKSLEPLIGARV